MKIYYRWQTFYVRDSREEWVEGWVYRVNCWEFQPVIFSTTCQWEEWRQQVKDWLDERAEELHLSSN